MKAKLLLSIALFSLNACSLIFTPKGTVKSFLVAAEKGDVDKMTSYFSQNAVEVIGRDKIRSNNQGFAELVQRGIKAGGAYRMEVIEQTSTSTGQRVAFVYRNQTDFIHLEFDLGQEGSKWQIDAIGSPEIPGIWGLGTFGAINPPVEVPTFSSPELVEGPSPQAKSDFKGTTISGGVLNGKAVSLPKPPYPPIAKAAKASGTVVVQVVVDENGIVITANAVSGHPLLRAAAVAAARGARFSPTKLAGQPVKISGVITYNFVAE